MGKPTKESVSYAKGYAIGRLLTLHELQDRLTSDQELRTLAGLAVLLESWIEDAEKERREVYER